MTLVAALAALCWLHRMACADIDRTRVEYLSDLQKYIEASHKASHRYDLVLKKYNALRGGGLCAMDHSPALNDTCIRIIVVKHAGLLDDSGSEYDPLIKTAFQNALALQPNTILIDEEWLDTIFLNIIFHYTFSTRMKVSTFETGFTEARFQTFMMMRRALGNDAEVNKYFKPASRLANQYMTDLNGEPKKSLFMPLEGSLIVAALSILFEHEIAHLDTNTAYDATLRSLEEQRSAGTLDEKKAAVTRRLAYLDEERRADKVAIERSSKMLDSQIPAGVEPERYSTLRAYVRLPLLGLSALFRDRVLFSGLDGFRGFHSEDIMLEFAHTACDGPRGSGNFNDPDIIQSARERPMPVLSRSEFDRARARLLSEPAGQETHDHFFLRAKNIEQQIRSVRRSDYLDFMESDSLLPLVDALVSNDPRKAYDKESDKFYPPIDGARPMAEVVDELKSMARVEEGVTCPTSHCYVGYLNDELGYMELIGRESSISEVRWMLKISGSSQKQYIENMVKMTAFFLTMGANINDIANVRLPFYKCSPVSSLLEKQNLVYHSTTVNRGGWVYIRMFSPKVFSAMDAEAAAASGSPIEASFPCSTASNSDEVAVCGNRSLASLDKDVARKYAAAFAKLPIAGRAALRSSQRTWLAERRRCGSNEDCLTKTYQQRSAALDDH